MNPEIINVYIPVALLGLCVGSFLNVCIVRIPVKNSIWFSRSECVFCRHQLSWKDLIPLLSYILLGCKCRYCKKKISFRYFFVEAVTGFLFLSAYLHFNGEPLNIFIFLFFSCILIIITFIDFRYYIIPDGLILILIITGFIFSFLSHYPLNVKSFYTALSSTSGNIINSIAGAFLSGIIMYAILLAGDWYFKKMYNKEALGGGDVKLVFCMGFFLGWKLSLEMLLLSAFLGAAFSLLLIAVRVKNLRDHIPFGPFIALGGIITYCYGIDIINWYLNWTNNTLILY